MKTSQKRAIWYAERKKQLARQNKIIDENNLREEFKKSHYKTMTGFLKAKGYNPY